MGMETGIFRVASLIAQGLDAYWRDKKTREQFAKNEANANDVENQLQDRIPEYSKMYQDTIDKSARGRNQAFADQIDRLTDLTNDATGRSIERRTRQLGEYDRGASELSNAYLDRVSRGTGIIDTMGEEAQADINKSYDDLGLDLNTDLADSGLSAVAGAINRLNAQERAGTSGRSAESVKVQRANADMQLSGDYLGAKSAEVANRIGLKSNLDSDVEQTQSAGEAALYGTRSNQDLQRIAEDEQNAQTKLELERNLSDQYLAFKGKREFPVPNTNWMSEVGTSLQGMSNWMAANKAAHEIQHKANNPFSWLGLGGGAMGIAGIPLMLTNAAAPGLGFALGAGLTLGGSAMAASSLSRR